MNFLTCLAVNNVQHKSEKVLHKKKVLKIQVFGCMALTRSVITDLSGTQKHTTLVLAACYSPCLVKQVTKKEQNVYLQWRDL
jgi:hypothetical protein